MGLRDLFRLKKKIVRCDEKRNNTLITVSSDNKEAPTPYAYNSALFEKFYYDLEHNTLPKILDPAKSEIMEYTQKKNKQPMTDDPLSDFADKNQLRENNAIPVEVEIWVDKVFDYYFDQLMPMMGLVHWCEGARKAL